MGLYGACEAQAADDVAAQRAPRSRPHERRAPATQEIVCTRSMFVAPAVLLWPASIRIVSPDRGQALALQESRPLERSSRRWSR